MVVTDSFKGKTVLLVGFGVSIGIPEIERLEQELRNLSDSSCVVVSPNTQSVHDMDLLREKTTRIERLVPLMNPFKDLELSIKALNTGLDEQQNKFVRYNTSKKEVILIIYVVLIKIYRCRSPTFQNKRYKHNRKSLLEINLTGFLFI